jgi:hypothetical protein
MSFEEISALLKAVNEKEKRQWERDRIGWFYSLIAPGMSKTTKPEDICIFSWEKKEVKPRKLTKAQFEEKTKLAEKWLNNR